MHWTKLTNTRNKPAHSSIKNTQDNSDRQKILEGKIAELETELKYNLK